MLSFLWEQIREAEIKTNNFIDVSFKLEQNGCIIMLHLTAIPKNLSNRVLRACKGISKLELEHMNLDENKWVKEELKRFTETILREREAAKPR